MYKLIRDPAPQNALLSPGHSDLHSESVTLRPGVAPVLPARLSALPHQHSRPYSTPAQSYSQQRSAQALVVMLTPSLKTCLGRRRPLEGSATQA